MLDKSTYVLNNTPNKCLIINGPNTGENQVEIEFSSFQSKYFKQRWFSFKSHLKSSSLGEIQFWFQKIQLWFIIFCFDNYKFRPGLGSNSILLNPTHYWPLLKDEDLVLLNQSDDNKNRFKQKSLHRPTNVVVVHIYALVGAGISEGV